MVKRFPNLSRHWGIEVPTCRLNLTVVNLDFPTSSYKSGRMKKSFDKHNYMQAPTYLTKKRITMKLMKMMREREQLTKLDVCAILMRMMVTISEQCVRIMAGRTEGAWFMSTLSINNVVLT